MSRVVDRLRCDRRKDRHVLATLTVEDDGALVPGTQGEISPSAPGWFVDQPSAPTDFDVGEDPAVGQPSRPWSSGPRPSDIGFTQAFYPEQSGQTQGSAPDSTGRTGAHVPRLRFDDGAQGVLP